ncbi:NahK/ErcS family hybrid sensor histidine kinase/response regulator [Azospirillum sp. TSO22-1]|uniref:NahK/ErcS family hybrid sensor histidine kinase/response regulator n=1 Tax=Azospirillum sp. TSO22-1 TaxID=716789 RepID=UPI0013049653|nr:NahK/ErcS family hybrid sensor histidine kinase/response regulator [Azospirillum sp. TSO22-1]
MGALLLLLLAFLLPFPAHAAPPSDWAGRETSSGVDPLMLQSDRWPARSDFWRDVRNGTEGTVNQPSPWHRGVLIQLTGADWGSVRTDIVATYGTQLAGVSAAVLLGFLMLHGRLRAAAWTLARWAGRVRDLERLAYGVTALSFVLLGVTGLTILYGRRMIAPLVGKETFAAMALLSKQVHDLVSWTFMLGVVLLVLVWIRNHVPNRWRDAAANPSIARPLGATAHLVFWSAVGGGIVVSYSGLALLFPLALVELQKMQIMQIVHSVSSLTLAALIFGHVLIASIVVRENARKLIEAKEELERRVEERTAELTREIAERRAVEAALEAARNQAEEANRSKDRFLAAASHDLLQPLSAARLMVASLLERAMRPENRELVENIHTALTGADDLLSDLLDISKLDAGGVTPQVTEVALGPLLDAMAAEFAPLAEAAGLALTVMPCRATVRTDAHLLRRVLRNLVSNAIRYTREGRVLVGCRRIGANLRVEVWDTGIGIPADKLGAIFQEFHREGRAARIHARGAGLGLAIVERIARVLGHAVGVRSVVGKGSAFTLTVPRVHAAAAPVAVAAPDGEDDLAGVAILAIDNDESVLMGLTSLLRAWDCEVLPGSVPEDAIAAAQRAGFVPDLLITDFHLDEGAIGADVVRAARQVLGAGIPAIIVTADRSPEVRERIERAGAHLLYKPVKPAKLRALVSHALAPVAEAAE